MSKLLDEILSNDNMNLAFKSVKANKGAYGVDEVTLDDLSEYIKDNWKDIKSKIEERKYIRGAVTMTLSNRSMIPPCPGISFP